MRRMYFGWYVVAAAIAANALLFGATYSAFGLYVLPVSAEFGLSRADMNTSLIFLNVGNAIISPLLGRLLDRVSARWIVVGSALLFGASLTILGLSESLWINAAVIIFPLALSMAGAGSLTMMALVARWFVAQRGRAMTLAAMGNAVSGVLGAPIAGYLISSQGWRHSLILSGAVGAVLLVAIGLFLRDRPGAADISDHPLEFRSGIATAGDDASAPAKVGDMLLQPQLWAMGVASALALCMSQAVSISLVPMALGQKLTLLQATSLASIAGSAAFIGKLLFSTVADRIDRVLLLTGIYSLGALANLAMFIGGGYPLLAMNAALLGVCVGIHVPSFNALLADRFGANSFGTVRGVMIPISATFGALSVRFAGAVFDRHGSYKYMFATFIVLHIAAAALMLSSKMLLAARAKFLAAGEKGALTPTRALQKRTARSSGRPGS